MDLQATQFHWRVLRETGSKGTVGFSCWHSHCYFFTCCHTSFARISTFQPFTSPPSSTPKMDRIRSFVYSQVTMMYTSPFDFLYTQPSFDLVFGPSPTMLRLSSRNNKQCITKDTKDLAQNCLVFVTPVSCTFFVTSSNFNILEQRPMTRKRCLLIYLSP